jgi:hypothetical protein
MSAGYSRDVRAEADGSHPSGPSLGA